jgi:hypothetical protein
MFDYDSAEKGVRTKTISIPEINDSVLNLYYPFCLFLDNWRLEEKYLHKLSKDVT